MNCAVTIFRRYVCLVFLAGFTVSICAAENQVTLVNGWVRASLPGAENSVAFLTLHNDSAETRQIVAVGCTVAKQCELHQHVHVDGKMRMEKVGQLTLPPRGDLVLASGGYHVMLLGLVAPLVAGSTVELVFILADKSSHPVVVPVKSVHDER